VGARAGGRERGGWESEREINRMPPFCVEIVRELAEIRPYSQCAQADVCIDMYICVYIHIYIYISYKYIYIYVYIYIYMSVRVCVYIYIHMYI